MRLISSLLSSPATSIETKIKKIIAKRTVIGIC